LKDIGSYGCYKCYYFTFSIFLEKNKKKSRNYLIWAVLFLAASFAAIEYAFWVEGVYLFNLIFGFNFPLISYFLIWFAFTTWVFETRKERKIWVIFLILLIIVTIAALACPNCIRF